MKSNLIFIGMPAVGKSTVGIVVAKRLGMNFIDTDLLIQDQEKKLLRESVNREIFGQITVDIFQKLFNLRIRRIRSAVRNCTGLQKNSIDINHTLRKKSIAEYFITKVLIFYGIFKFTQKITEMFLNSRINTDKVKTVVSCFLETGI